MPAKTKKGQKTICVIFAISLFFLILTTSIGLPIYIRPFYYAHIAPLELVAESGFSLEQIKTAYDSVLDYLTLPGKPFSVGDLACSADAQAHFADCKFLFDLNASVLVLSGCMVLMITLLRKRGKIGPLYLGKRSAAFWAALCAIVLPVVLGSLAALDFDRAFVIFHSLFFPGKDNWYFSWNADQIIRILPQVFFRNCAILIGAGVFLSSFAILITEKRRSAGRNTA